MSFHQGGTHLQALTSLMSSSVQVRERSHFTANTLVRTEPFFFLCIPEDLTDYYSSSTVVIQSPVDGSLISNAVLSVLNSLVDSRDIRGHP